MAECPEEQTVHIYDNGTKFVLQVVDCKLVNGVPTEEIVDISGATDMKVIFRKTDYTSLKVAAALYTDGLDGKIVYAVTGDPEAKTGDLDQLGSWSVMGRVTLPGSGTWSTGSGTFIVDENFD